MIGWLESDLDVGLEVFPIVKGRCVVLCQRVMIFVDQPLEGSAFETGSYQVQSLFVSIIFESKKLVYLIQL